MEKSVALICYTENAIKKLIELNLQRIIEIRLHYRVKSLAVFGSILTNRFTEDSDIDLLIDFDLEGIDHDNPHGFDYLSNFLGLEDSLKSLLGREIDLVVGSSLRNKVFIENVNRTKQVIYG